MIRGLRVENATSSIYLTVATVLVFTLWGAPSAVLAQPNIRIMAANISSGNLQSYDPGHGTRIFQGLDPDVVLIQEFNYGDNSASAISGWVQSTFGADFSYFRESGAQIANGIISRYPIIDAGEWTDTQVSNRDFAWARIDVPGAKDLWAVSVHLLTSGSGVRNTEATNLRNFIQANVPAGDYLVLGGNLNTDNRTEAALTTLNAVVNTGAPYPADANGNSNTNASRSKPYDWLMADDDLGVGAIPLVIGSQSFTNGLVFDSRVFTPLTDVAPVLAADSGASNMQHMAVVRDFALPLGNTTFNSGGASAGNFAAAPVKGGTDQPIGRIHFSSPTGEPGVSEIEVTLSGSTRSGLSNLKMWYTTADTFSTPIQLGDTVAEDPGTSAISFSGSVSVSVPTWFWLTADLASDATGTVVPEVAGVTMAAGSVAGFTAPQPMTSNTAVHLPVSLSAVSFE